MNRHRGLQGTADVLRRRLGLDVPAAWYVWVWMVLRGWGWRRSLVGL